MKNKTFYITSISDKSTDKRVSISMAISDEGFSHTYMSVENMEKIRSKSKEWRENNPEEWKEIQNRYDNKNPDRWRNYKNSERLFTELCFTDESSEKQVAICLRINKNGEWSEYFKHSESRRISFTEVFFIDDITGLYVSIELRILPSGEWTEDFRADNAREWYKNNPDKVRRHNKNFRSKYLEEQREREREYRRYNPEVGKAWRQNNPEKIRAYCHKRRRLGFVPLNSWFKGSEAHHVDEEHVIYIPAEIHRSFPHCLESGEGMAEINKIAFRFLESERRQVSKLEEFVEV